MFVHFSKINQKLKHVIVFLALLFTSVGSFATDWETLIGKNIVITESDAIISPFVYSDACLPKFKFKHDYLAETSIVNKPLIVKDVVIKSENDKQKRNLNIVVSSGNETFVIHFLLSSPYGSSIPCYFGTSSLLNLHTSSGSMLTNCCSPSNVRLNYIDLGLVDEINSKYKDYIVKDEKFVSVVYNAKSDGCVATFTNNKNANQTTQSIQSNDSLLSLMEKLSKGVKYETPIESSNGNVIRF